jgi:hypothetical protein
MRDESAPTVRKGTTWGYRGTIEIRSIGQTGYEAQPCSFEIILKYFNSIPIFIP